MPERGAPQWEGSRRPEPGTKRTMQDIFQKLDKLVTPGVGQASTSSQTADGPDSRWTALRQPMDRSGGTCTLPKGTLSALRRLPKPPSAKTWREAVVAKFSQTPGYQDPNKFNK